MHFACLPSSSTPLLRHLFTGVRTSLGFQHRLKLSRNSLGLQHQIAICLPFCCETVIVGLLASQPVSHSNKSEHACLHACVRVCVFYKFCSFKQHSLTHRFPRSVLTAPSLSFETGHPVATCIFYTLHWVTSLRRRDTPCTATFHGSAFFSATRWYFSLARHPNHSQVLILRRK